MGGTPSPGGHGLGSPAATHWCGSVCLQTWLSKPCWPEENQMGDSFILMSPCRSPPSLGWLETPSAVRTRRQPEATSWRLPGRFAHSSFFSLFSLSPSQCPDRAVITRERAGDGFVVRRRLVKERREPEHIPPGAQSWLTWKCPVIRAGGAGPGAPEPLVMVIHPTTGLLRKVKVAVESRRQLQIFV